MQWVVLGLNHKTVPVEIREKFAMTAESIKSGLRHIHDLEGMREAVILSTCNRTEIYAVLDGSEGRTSLEDFFLTVSGNTRADAKKNTFIILKVRDASVTFLKWCPGWIPWFSERARF